MSEKRLTPLSCYSCAGKN